MRAALISGITSGTFGSMRKAEELSITTAPPLTASGANLREMLPPAENSAMSTPSNARSVSSSIPIGWPRKVTVLPAERALASAFSLPTRKLRRSMVAMNSAPTAPVTPTIATTGSLLTFVLHSRVHAGNKKAPDLFEAGLRVKICDWSDYARTPPEPRQGLVVLVVVFAVSFMARTYAGGNCCRQRGRKVKSALNRLNWAWLSRHKPTHEPSQQI